jgi:hypothetical protein
VSTPLFNRKCTVLIGTRTDTLVLQNINTGDVQTDTTVTGKEYSNLRVSFSIKKSLEKEPNTAEVTVYNLSEDTRGKLVQKFTPIILRAGYGSENTAGNFGIIFQGDARTIDHVRQGPDWQTKMALGDGERAYGYAYTEQSFKGNTPHTTVIRALVSATLLNAGNLEAALVSPRFTSPSATFRRGYSFHGRAYDALEKLMRSHGFGTSIQGGALLFTPLQFSRSDFTQTAPLISEASGMVGSPEHGTPDKKNNKPALLKVRTLLRPEIQCGGLVSIQAERVKGTYLVANLNHNGDTMGGAWYTDLEVKPL